MGDGGLAMGGVGSRQSGLWRDAAKVGEVWRLAKEWSGERRRTGSMMGMTMATGNGGGGDGAGGVVCGLWFQRLGLLGEAEGDGGGV